MDTTTTTTSTPSVEPLQTPTPIPPQYKGENEHILTFLKENKIDLEPFDNDANPASNAFQKVIKRVNLAFINLYERGPNGPGIPSATALVPVYQECVHYTRRKLKQGRMWSKKLVDAIQLDYVAAFTHAIANQKAQGATETPPGATTTMEAT